MQAVAPSWKPISWKGAPKGKDGTVAVSAGDRLLVLVDEGGGATAAGWYDPAKDRWAKAPSLDLPYRFRPALVWTGDEVVLWGGRNTGPKFFGDGARLIGDRWETLPKKLAPAARAPHAVWSGRELIVWGGASRKIVGDGALYRPREAAWHSIDDKGAPSAREDASAIWTGRELWVFGGVNENDDDFDGEPYSDGAAYDPAVDRWRPLADLPKAAASEAFVFFTSRGVVLIETSKLRVWQIALDGKRWARLSVEGEPGIEGAEGVTQVRDRLVVRAPLGRAVLDLETLKWLSVPKATDLGSLETMTEVSHQGDLIVLDGKHQKGARLELYK